MARILRHLSRVPFPVIAMLISRLLPALSLLLLATPAFAIPVRPPSPVANLVTNGGFETTLTTGAAEIGVRHPSQQATGWTTSGYNFVFTPGTADTIGAAGEYDNVLLWGPNNGSANALPASSPDGGNFIGADGAFGVGAIQQTITGLIVGQTATLTFTWAGAQQYSYDGATTERFDVSLGDETHSTETVSLASHGFSGWRSVTMTFTPTSTTEVLSFLAAGTPSGQPPFSLLDGVSLTQNAVPEPASLTLLGAGLAFGAAASRKKRK